jgi:hypothetical protein
MIARHQLFNGDGATDDGFQSVARIRFIAPNKWPSAQSVFPLGKEEMPLEGMHRGARGQKIERGLWLAVKKG